MHTHAVNHCNNHYNNIIIEYMALHWPSTVIILLTGVGFPVKVPSINANTSIVNSSVFKKPGKQPEAVWPFSSRLKLWILILTIPYSDSLWAFFVATATQFSAEFSWKVHSKKTQPLWVELRVAFTIIVVLMCVSSPSVLFPETLLTKKYYTWI